jgi:hypothetical protein
VTLVKLGVIKVCVSVDQVHGELVEAAEEVGPGRRSQIRHGGSGLGEPVVPHALRSRPPSGTYATNTTKRLFRQFLVNRG